MRGSAVTGVTLAEFDSSNLSASLHIATPVLIANYGFAVLAGVFWYFQFFFYSMGQVKMGRYDFSSWTLHMASIIIFAGLWGLVLKEWCGTSRNARALMALGLMLLIASTLVVGYGNYLQMSPGRGTTTQN
jgi:L-rhamnose-H+ transport protein